jgi:hypothetical protein
MTPEIERLALRHAAALVEYYKLDKLNSESSLDYYKLDKIAAAKTIDAAEAELHAACQAFSQGKK